MELERSTIIFLMLIGILILGSFFVKESFVSTTNDASGSVVKVSIKDLISILNMTGSATTTPTTTTSTTGDVKYDKLRQDLLNSQKESSNKLTGTSQDTKNTLEGDDYYTAFKNEILQEVRSSVRNELQKKQDGSVLTDSCIDSVANQQGTDWMRYIPGKNPADYIRKDSIPCYGCNLA